MNNKKLTGMRKILFLKIAESPNISQSQLCSYSRLRGGELTRINHHLMGLESEGFIQVVNRGNRGQYKYKITADKGRKMWSYLQSIEKSKFY
jgi:hypothetical protein